jgi:CheY-like chemotaxis protein
MSPDAQDPPAEASTKKRRQQERRRLWDRRAPESRRATERRTLERRRARKDKPAERRSADRREGDRRANADRRGVLNRRRGRRRRDTPTPYTSAEVTTLRAQFAATRFVSCPSCGAGFSLGPAHRRAKDNARRVVCLGCGRAAVIPNSIAARVLVLDAADDSRGAVVNALATAGHDVVAAADGRVGLAAYQAVPADVVLVNVHETGRIDAGEFLRRLRRIHPEARVVAMARRPSAHYGDPLALSRGLGSVLTLRMPAARSDLLRAVDDAQH